MNPYDSFESIVVDATKWRMLERMMRSWCRYWDCPPEQTSSSVTFEMTCAQKKEQNGTLCPSCGTTCRVLRSSSYEAQRTARIIFSRDGRGLYSRPVVFLCRDESATLEDMAVVCELPPGHEHAIP